MDSSIQPLGSPLPVLTDEALLTEDVIERIAQVVRAGNPVRAAARWLGVGQMRMEGWLLRGARERFEQNLSEFESPFVRLHMEFERALGAFEIHHVALISRAAADGNWAASLELLKRRFPDEWDHRRNHSAGAAAPAVNINVQPPEVRIAIFNRLAGASAPPDNLLGYPVIELEPPP